MTVTDVAEIMNVSPRLIYQLVSIGDIPHFRVGKAVRFEPKSVSDWLHQKLKAAGKKDEYDNLPTGVSGNIWDSVKEMTIWWRDVLLPKERSGKQVRRA